MLAEAHLDREQLAEAEAALRLAEEALERGIAQIRTPEQAAAAIAQLEAAARRLSAEDAQARPDATVKDRARAISRAAHGGSVQSAVEVVEETARQAAADDETSQPVLDEAIAAAAGTGGAGEPPDSVQRGRSLLRQALLDRLQPFEAFDTILFLSVNGIPHPRWLDRGLAKYSWAMTGGAGWIVLLFGHLLLRGRAGLPALLGAGPALWLATYTVEGPVKRFFRRRRPFVSLVRAIVVGRKPGSFSFPSGHSAAAFAGATMMQRYFPQQRSLWFAMAGLVGFSRVYLGAHYPGDVVIGAAVGGVLARVYHRALGKLWRKMGGR